MLLWGEKMANEKRLIDANALMVAFRIHMVERYDRERCYSKENCKTCGRPCLWYEKINNAPTVDAVEVQELKEFASNVAYQFGYYCHNKGRLHITHGGLSTLEQAFDFLGWENPHPVPECECEIDGCHEHATCGAPTADGYKRMCGKHCRERERQ